MYQIRKSWAMALLPEADRAEVWRPPVDVFRTTTGWVLRFDLAGVRLEDLTVSRVGRRVTVSGIRRDQLVREGWCCHSMEISWSRFERAVELPDVPDGAVLALELQNGILLVRVGIGE